MIPRSTAEDSHYRSHRLRWTCSGRSVWPPLSNHHSLPHEGDDYEFSSLVQEVKSSLGVRVRKIKKLAINKSRGEHVEQMTICNRFGSFSESDRSRHTEKEAIGSHQEVQSMRVFYLRYPTGKKKEKGKRCPCASDTSLNYILWLHVFTRWHQCASGTLFLTSADCLLRGLMLPTCCQPQVFLPGSDWRNPN